MPQRIIQHLSASTRGRNLVVNVFEMWVGLAGILTGVVFFWKTASIESGAVDVAVGHNVAIIWNVGYFVAGLLIWWGLLRPSPRWEVVALWGIGTFTAIESIAIWALFGLRGSASAILLLALAAASWTRATIVTNAALRLTEGAPGGPD